jgi:hypothetical protein
MRLSIGRVSSRAFPTPQPGRGGFCAEKHAANEAFLAAVAEQMGRICAGQRSWGRRSALTAGVLACYALLAGVLAGSASLSTRGGDSRRRPTVDSKGPAGFCPPILQTGAVLRAGRG